MARFAGALVTEVGQCKTAWRLESIDLWLSDRIDSSPRVPYPINTASRSASTLGKARDPSTRPLESRFPTEYRSRLPDPAIYSSPGVDFVTSTQTVQLSNLRASWNPTSSAPLPPLLYQIESSNILSRSPAPHRPAPCRARSPPSTPLSYPALVPARPRPCCFRVQPLIRLPSPFCRTPVIRQLSERHDISRKQQHNKRP